MASWTLPILSTSHLLSPTPPPTHSHCLIRSIQHFVSSLRHFGHFAISPSPTCSPFFYFSLCISSFITFHTFFFTYLSTTTIVSLFLFIIFGLPAHLPLPVLPSLHIDIFITITIPHFPFPIPYPSIPVHPPSTIPL